MELLFEVLQKHLEHETLTVDIQENFETGSEAITSELKDMARSDKSDGDDLLTHIEQLAIDSFFAQARNPWISAFTKLRLIFGTPRD